MRAQFPSILCLALLSAGCHKGADADKSPPDSIRLEPGSARLDFIKIEPVEESSSAALVAFTGKIALDEEHTQRVSSPIDGRVTEIKARPGDAVKAGQPLIALSAPAVGQILADAQKALQDLEVAQKSTLRATKLRAEGAISEKEAAQVESDFKKARSDVSRTAAQLHSLGISLSDPTPNAALFAHLPGVVVERTVLVGQEVRANSSQPLMTITSLDTVWALADVYEQDLSLVQSGARVVIHVSAYPDVEFPGVVAHIGETVDAQSRTVKIRCVALNPDHRLKPEMFAKIDLKGPSGTKMLLIPAKAVLNESDTAKVIVAGPNQTFHLRRISSGPQVDDKIRVLAGLTAGEKIVTDGVMFLKRDIETE